MVNNNLINVIFLKKLVYVTISNKLKKKQLNFKFNCFFFTKNSNIYTNIIRKKKIFIFIIEKFLKWGLY